MDLFLSLLKCFGRIFAGSNSLIGEKLSSANSQILNTETRLQLISLWKFLRAYSHLNDLLVALLAAMRNLNATSIASATLLKIGRRVNSIQRLTRRSSRTADLGLYVFILSLQFVHSE